MKILIADDHGIVRAGMRLLLDRQADMDVVAEAEDGVDAFETALRTRPDLCVLDVSMPGMTGFELLQQLRDEHELGDTPVIFLSARVQPEDVQAGIDMGATYLTKPFVAAALLSAVDRALAPDDDGGAW